MEENAGGADVTLSKDDLEALATLLSHMTVQGNRYTEAMAATIDR